VQVGKDVIGADGAIRSLRADAALLDAALSSEHLALRPQEHALAALFPVDARKTAAAWQGWVSGGPTAGASSESSQQDPPARDDTGGWFGLVGSVVSTAAETVHAVGATSVGTLGVAATAASKDLVGLETFAKELARQQLTLSWLSSTLSTHHAAAGSGEELQEALVSRAKAAGILTIDVTAEVQARQKQPQTPSGTHTFTKEDPARRERTRQLQDLLTTLEHEDAMSLMQKIKNAKNPEQKKEVGEMVDMWMESQSKKGLFDPDGKNSVKSEAWLAYEREQVLPPSAAAQPREERCLSVSWDTPWPSERIGSW
jgi:hypothetical protein